MTGKQMSFFDRYLTLWVAICMGVGVGLGKAAPGVVAALRGLVRTVFSDYPRLRAALGFTLYDEAAMVEKLKLAGFAANRAPRNLGHNQARMTFMAQPH